jgi:hypothetical protein
MAEEFSATIRVGSTDVRIRLYPDPPPGFDPQTADDRSLRIHGFPARPDAGSQPALRDQWDHAVARIRRRVRPQFRVSPDRRHGPRRPHPALADPRSAQNWSGAVVPPPANDSWQWVQGTWTVPNCATPVLSPGVPGPDCFSSTWIGIDGGVQSSDPWTDVVQAGSESDSYAAGGTNIFLWWEWASVIPQVVLTNFPVDSGDLMNCMICVEPSSSGPVATFFMFNYISGLYTVFSVPKPIEEDFLGNTAEWIVEAPALESPLGNVGIVQPLTNFGAIFFDGAQAGTVKNITVNCGDPSSSLVYLYGAKSGQLLAEPTLENAQCLKVTRMNPDFWD